MTFKEKLKKEHPDLVFDNKSESVMYFGGCFNCPSYYKYERPEYSPCYKNSDLINEEFCAACWNREIPEESTQEEQESETKKAYQEGYEKGCQEAWGFVQKICCSTNEGGYDYEEIHKIFKTKSITSIFNRSYRENKELYDKYLFEQEEKKENPCGRYCRSSHS